MNFVCAASQWYVSVRQVFLVVRVQYEIFPTLAFIRPGGPDVFHLGDTTDRKIEPENWAAVPAAEAAPKT
jgi:hypothetical protein